MAEQLDYFRERRADAPMRGAREAWEGVAACIAFVVSGVLHWRVGTAIGCLGAAIYLPGALLGVLGMIRPGRRRRASGAGLVLNLLGMAVMVLGSAIEMIDAPIRN